LNSEIGLRDALRFQDAEKYAAYLKTPAGRLRSELAWENLRRFLPRDAAKHQALDVGGGTGSASVQLAVLGHEVVLVDSSDQMLRIARQDADACSVTPRISFCHAETGQLRELFAAESFDVVVCHNLLEYSEVPSTTVCDIAHVLRKNGVFSVLVRNRAGEVLRDAVKTGEWKLANANLTAETVLPRIYTNFLRAPDWKLSLNVASAYFSTTWPSRIRRMKHTRKSSSWNRRWERGQNSSRLRATSS
jgi:ubiquinone/menaquinone biosynthesis C-methylase UbiE